MAAFHFKFIQQKTDAGTFFSKFKTIFSDIIQVWP